MHNANQSPTLVPLAFAMAITWAISCSVPASALESGILTTQPKINGTTSLEFTRAQEPPLPAFNSSASRSVKQSGDPGMAATLGIIPIASGFYATQKIEVGYLFTGVDLVLLGAIFAARGEDASYKKDSEKVYWGALIASNLLDAFFSYRQAKHENRLSATGGITPDGQWETALTWKF